MKNNDQLELKILRKIVSIQNSIIGGISQKGHNAKYLTDQEKEKDKSNDKDFQKMKQESFERIIEVLTNEKKWVYHSVITEGELKVYEFCKELLREETTQ